ncbi:MAG: DUF5126 domain-containing protein [Cytophagales bacterium]|nr:DUF5126 domain-containing protein [Cytophagales bacterium]
MVKENKANKMKKYINIVLFIFLFAQACKEDDVLTHAAEDSVPPANVTEVKITPKFGGASVSYLLPNDRDLHMVRIDYEISPGKWRTSTSTVFNNELEIGGFGDTKEKKFVIYTLDRSGNKSDEAEYTFNPLTPPHQLIRQSFKTAPDFGGLHLNWVNTAQAEVAVYVLTKNDDGELEEKETFYSSLKEGDEAVRGFKAEERTFGLYVRDRWDNYSDTLIVKLTPIYEEKFDKSKIKEVRLDNSVNLNNYGGNFQKMFNDKIGNDFGHSQIVANPPATITMDLGVKAKISRFVWWQRISPEWVYGHCNPRRWELWGTNEKPSKDGSNSGWTKLGTYESIKPSGLPDGQHSDEDMQAAKSGEECIIPIDAPPFRYLRYIMLENWSGGTDIHISEISIFGQLKKSE